MPESGLILYQILNTSIKCKQGQSYISTDVYTVLSIFCRWGHIPGNLPKCVYSGVKCQLSLTPSQYFILVFSNLFHMSTCKTLFCKISGRSYSQLKATNPEHPRPSLTPSRAQGAPSSVLEGLQLRNSAVCVHLVLTSTWHAARPQIYTRGLLTKDSTTLKWQQKQTREQTAGDFPASIW